MPKPSPIKRQTMVTEKQIHFIEILFNDCGFSLLQRKDWLNNRNLPVFLDELTGGQAGHVIDKLLVMKEERSPRSNLEP